MTNQLTFFEQLRPTKELDYGRAVEIARLAFTGSDHNSAAQRNAAIVMLERGYEIPEELPVLEKDQIEDYQFARFVSDVLRNWKDISNQHYYERVQPAVIDLTEDLPDIEVERILALAGMTIETYSAAGNADKIQGAFDSMSPVTATINPHPVPWDRDEVRAALAYDGVPEQKEVNAGFYGYLGEMAKSMPHNQPSRSRRLSRLSQNNRWRNA